MSYRPLALTENACFRMLDERWSAPATDTTNGIDPHLQLEILILEFLAVDYQESATIPTGSCRLTYLTSLQSL